jgi:hypothetical protein
MITRIRIEAQADSLEQAKREIDILMAHAKTAALLEGIASDLHETTDEHYGAFTEEEQANEVMFGRYKGRQVARFAHNKVEEGGLKQYGFKVLDADSRKPDAYNTTSEPTGVITYSGTLSSTMWSSWTENAGLKDVTDEHMVLRRANPASREHTWQTVPANPARTVRVALRDGSANCTVDWEDDETLVEDVAQRAANELHPKQDDGDRWTFQIGYGEAVINPQCKAGDYLADGLKLMLVRQNSSLLYGKLPGIIPLETHSKDGLPPDALDTHNE